jgi:hypothetical protein
MDLLLSRISTVFCVFLTAFGVGVLVAPAAVFAEIGDREFVRQAEERRRDFERVLKEREKALLKQPEASIALKEKRLAEKKRRAEVLAAYLKVMKRYSMEEQEALDAANEVQVEQREAAYEKMRSQFVEARNRRRTLEESMAPIDPYREFGIDMSVRPEFKSSYPVTENLDK